MSEIKRKQLLRTRNALIEIAETLDEMAITERGENGHIAITQLTYQLQHLAVDARHAAFCVDEERFFVPHGEVDDLPF